MWRVTKFFVTELTHHRALFADVRSAIGNSHHDVSESVAFCPAHDAFDGTCDVRVSSIRWISEEIAHLPFGLFGHRHCVGNQRSDVRTYIGVLEHQSANIAVFVIGSAILTEKIPFAVFVKRVHEWFDQRMSAVTCIARVVRHFKFCETDERCLNFYIRETLQSIKHSTRTVRNKMDTLFAINMLIKRMHRTAAKYEKEMKSEERLMVRAIARNDEAAKIYAQNVIRLKHQRLDCIKAEGHLKSVACQVEKAIRMRQITHSLHRTTQLLVKLDATMGDATVTMRIMEQFNERQEDLDVQATVVGESMNANTAMQTPRDEVQELLEMAATAHNLQLGSALLPAPHQQPQPSAASAAASSGLDTTELEDRFNKLKS